MIQKDENFKLGRIMIVDDEAELMTALCEALAGRGYETAGFANGADALKVLSEDDYDLLLTDLMMPEMDGIALLKAGLEIDPNLVGIIMTGHGTVQTAVDAMKIGAFDYVLKPFKLNVVLPLLSRAMEVRNLRMENIQLRETVAIHELGKSIAFSTDLHSILNKVVDAALQQCNADEASVMLPTHDGKELYVAVARGGHTEHIGIRLPMDQGVAGWVAQYRETVILRGEVNDQRFSPINPRADILAAVSMPMLAGGNLVGVLNVNVIKGHRHLTLGQVKGLTILVSIIAPILENTWLNIQIRQAEEKYRSLFENAVEGIYRTTPKGQFITANPAVADILGYNSPEELMSEVTDIAQQCYVEPEERAAIIADGSVKKRETRFYRKDGSVIWVSINVQAVHGEKGRILYYECMIEDISERKSREKQQELTNKILGTLNSPNEIVNLIRDILILLKEYMGIEAVGIRLREGDDCSYFVTEGFTPEFLKSDNYLCARDDAGGIIRDPQGNPCLECMCGSVISGRTDPALPFFTEGGSFWTNSTTKLLASTTEEDRQCRTRNRCNEAGYESVALVPLRSGNKAIGLLQLNDTRQNAFTIEMIRFMEKVGASIGIAVARKKALEELRESEENYRLHFENVNDLIYSIDSELRLLNISPSVEKLLGYKPEELIGRTIGEMTDLTPYESTKVVSDVAHTLAAGDGETFIYEFITKDGIKKFFETTGSSIKRNGKGSAAIFVARDITERKEAEEWLIRERSMIDRIMKTSPAGITVVDRAGRIVFANKRAEEIYCLANKELMQMTVEAFTQRITDFDGNPLSDEQQPFFMVMATGKPIYGVHHAFELNGRRAFLSINGAPILDAQGSISEVVFTIDDITQYRQAEEKIEQNLEKLQQSMRDTVKAMSMIVETKDPYTAGHQEHVAGLAVAIAEGLNLPAEQISGIEMAGAIHDIGKIYVPAEILSKPSRLSDIEMGLIRTHSQAGYDIMKDIYFSWPVAKMILEHHERMNGSGYPHGLSGNDILMGAKILAVADVVDAMSSHRPYRPAPGIDKALEEISANKGILYDPEVVAVCLKLFREENYKF